LGEKAISGKNSLWQRSTHVPLIFAGPGITRGERCEEPVELLDIYPTLAELAGFDAPADLEGLSLRPQLSDPATPRRRPAITTHNPDNHSVRSRRYRLIRYADGAEEFYDCQSDPIEQHNRIDDPALREVIEEHRRWLPPRSAPPAPGSRHRILVREGDQFLWEGEPIDPQKIPE
jgi:arylsulfatase A-like enzyme